jgi:predicted AAA+ superfamily ATPase
MTYVARHIDSFLDEYFDSLPAILLDGPKAVGKSSTASRRAKQIYDLASPRARELAAADSETVTLGETPIFIDEWQRVPEVWDAVKSGVDKNNRGGRFLLAGSAEAPGTHSGAGRIFSVRMRPMTLIERGLSTPTVSLSAIKSGTALIEGETNFNLSDYANAIVRGGFPGLQTMPDKAVELQLEGYVQRIIDKDMAEAGLSIRRPAALLAWLRSFAAATATTASWQSIRDGATAGNIEKPSRTATAPYIDLLTQLRIVDDIDAWLPSDNHLNRISQSPKHFLVDPALAASLLGISSTSLLSGDSSLAPLKGTPIFGRLFENLVAMHLHTFAINSRFKLRHLRTGNGDHEVDFILEQPDGRFIAVEAKLNGSASESDQKHLLWLKDKVGDQMIDAIVVTTGQYAYRTKQGIASVPLALLGP